MFKEKQLIKFLLFSVGLYLVWFVLYEFWLKNDGHLDQLITENITIIISWMLKLTGYDVHYTQAHKLGETFIFLNPNIFPFLRVGASCNGLELFILFTIFIICYPGNAKVKLVYIIIGNIIIHLLNIFRNYILALMVLHQSTYFDLFHRYVFIFFVYGSIFILWMIWTNKYSKLYVNRKQDK
ncbi:MAG: exosortase family protein XrtF [Bacteroidota bacterium]